MEGLVNSVKSAALGVGEFFTPVLKVRDRCVWDFFYQQFLQISGVEIQRVGRVDAGGVCDRRRPFGASLSDVVVGQSVRFGQSQALLAGRQAIFDY